MDDRLFTDWSSTEQPVVDPAGNEAMGNTLSDVTTIPSTHQQLSQVCTRFVDRETNTSEVEVRPKREETRTDIIYSHGRDLQMPPSHGSLSSHETDIIGGSQIRPCVTDIMPQLDGPTSVHARRRPEQEFVKGLLQCLEEDILMRVIVTLMIIGDHMMNEDTLEGGDVIMIEVEGHQIEEMTKREVIQEVEGHQIEDPLMMEDPLEMEDIQDVLEDKDHQAHQDLLDQYVQS